ncbi:MAG: hypothetical protein NTW26_11990, partial [bacterium]|nr:hypothetical protein [bacterium]
GGEGTCGSHHPVHATLLGLVYCSGNYNEARTVKQITHIRPLSLLRLYLPLLFTAWAVFGVSWLTGLGGSRELTLLVSQVTGGGFLLTFAVLIPVNTLVGVLGLAAFAAVYNRYNRGLLTLDLELLPVEDEPDARRLSEVSSRSLSRLFVPMLVLAAVNMAGTLGLVSTLGLGTLFYGEEPGLDVLLVNGLAGTFFVAGIVVLGGMLAAAIYNRVAAGGDGVRLQLAETAEGVVLRRFGLRSLGYALPSFLALTVIAVVLELILGALAGGDLVADALFSVGVAVPTLWLMPLFYNRLRGRGGIVFDLKQIDLNR